MSEILKELKQAVVDYPEVNRHPMILLEEAHDAIQSLTTQLEAAETREKELREAANDLISATRKSQCGRCWNYNTLELAEKLDKALKRSELIHRADSPKEKL